MMNIEEPKITYRLPQSSSNFWINLFCVILFFIAMYLGHGIVPKLGGGWLAAICLLVAVVPLWFYDFFQLKVYQRLSTGLLELPGKINRERFLIKLIGLYVTFLIILVLYYLNPVYRVSVRAVKFYGVFFDFLSFLGPFIIVASSIYSWYIDRRQKDPYDGYWHMGCLVTGRWREVNVVILQEHARVWFIKAFFIPFMFGLLVSYINELVIFDWIKGPFSFFLVVSYLLSALYMVDVLFGVLGYILTLRLFDTHIQSTEPTWWGWLVCLACYHPFYSIFGIGLLAYEDDFQWQHWLALDHSLYYSCGILILSFSLLYALATVAIGYRMSNLTYRGIITSGPYRFTKHPAYIGKMASWWLISLPFLSLDGSYMAAQHTFNMVIITLIYYMRARTEENHLSNYPEYVEYANWINEHGIFSFITKRFPMLQYSEEKCKRAKSVVWFKKLNTVSINKT